MLHSQKEKTANEYVFPLPKRWAYLAGQRALRRVLKRAGLPYVRFYDLRHTSATLALQHGVDVKMVSGMLGHFSVEKKMEIRGPLVSPFPALYTDQNLARRPLEKALLWKCSNKCDYLPHKGR